MPTYVVDSPGGLSPLESFLRDSVEAGGGAWDEVEPQVYDLLMDAETGPASKGQSITRVAFDPDALAEHPAAQLVSLGTPLVDRLIAGALERGRLVELHLLGLNLQPHQLAIRIIRSLKLTEGLSLYVHRIRPVDFPQMVFWFEATFISDQREQEIVPAATDLHFGREVRHLDLLLDESRLAETSGVLLPEAAGIGRLTAYRAAREQVLRSVASLANVRARELKERLDKQAGRMTRYYDDLAHELREQARRSRDAEASEKYNSRGAALARERELRIAELKKKNALRVELRLLITLIVHRPKLEIQATVSRPAAEGKPGDSAAAKLVWDPLTGSLEAHPCALCGLPTFELSLRQSALVCPACEKLPIARRRPR
jgi:hypothetical protein